jgi:hypothetical protein
LPRHPTNQPVRIWKTTKKEILDWFPQFDWQITGKHQDKPGENLACKFVRLMSDKSISACLSCLPFLRLERCRAGRYDINQPKTFWNSLSIRECLWSDNR